MPGVKIHGAEHAINDIFSNQFRFEIPPYQRPYGRRPEQAGETHGSVEVLEQRQGELVDKLADEWQLSALAPER